MSRWETEVCMGGGACHVGRLRLWCAHVHVRKDIGLLRSISRALWQKCRHLLQEYKALLWGLWRHLFLGATTPVGGGGHSGVHMCICPNRRGSFAEVSCSFSEIQGSFAEILGSFAGNMEGCLCNLPELQFVGGVTISSLGRV